MKKNDTVYYMNNKVTIDTDKNRLNIAFVHRFLTQTYWAKGRSMDIMKKCIDHSLNFGVYLNDNQIGYARLVTDYGQFAYLMDVFIIDEQRGQGYSKVLMEYIMNYEDLKHVKIWRLATADAHSLYQQYGFRPIAHPEKLMEYLK